MPWIQSCLCQQEKKKALVISPPIHLLLKPEGSHPAGSSHAFRCKVFKKPRLCHLCHQPIFNQGSCCRVCKYVCHKVCESKEAADRFTDTSWKIHRQWLKSNNLPNSQPTTTTRPGTIPINNNNHLTSSYQTLPPPPLEVDSANCNNKVPNDVYATIQSDSTSNSTTTTVRRKVVEIQTIQTNLERKPSSDIILHIHEDAKYGNPSNNNTTLSPAYGQPTANGALTTQPRRKEESKGSLAAAAANSSNMDLSYVTQRIYALWFPASCGQRIFRQEHRQASDMLINKHGDSYKLFNLSEPKASIRSEHKHVEDVGWSAHLAPPLEHLCSVCKKIDSWLSANQHHIAVLHARGCKDKLGVIVAAYMHYSNICGSAEQALDRFSMRRFLEDNIGPLYLPSNKRYVHYFAGLLSRDIKMNASPLYLTHVTVLGAPAYLNGGCRAFLKLFEGQTPIYTSGVYTVSSGVSQFTVNVAGERRKGLQLRGDILIKCYHRSDCDREPIFACQFHTCAVSDNTLSFTRLELDGACNDPRFPIDGAVELHFSSGADSRHPGPAPTPAIPVNMSEDRVTRADSPFDLKESDDEDDSDSDDINHTFGPLDGSIYATIAKKPELSPGAVSSPLTVSMDSGISSAGHQQNANTNASASPPLTGQPSPLSPEDQHRELDELLSDMMLTVQSIPDLKPQREFQNVHYIDEEEEHNNIPYHARQDSRPFSYGVNANSMIGDTKKLSSPSLVRKAGFNKNQNVPKTNGIEGAKDAIDNIFTSSALAANQRQTRQVSSSDLRNEFYKDPLKRSYTDSTLKTTTTSRTSTMRGKHYSDSDNISPSNASSIGKPDTQIYDSCTSANSNLTWLQKQQLKLKDRREMQRQEERQPYQHSLITELRSVQNRHLRQSASHRQDGYTSDTTAFADDDEDFTIPLHINTSKSSCTSNARTTNRKEISKYREEHGTWRSTDVDSNSSHLMPSRPQTPAFPVARTPYANSSTPTVQFDLPGERLPPKSPTTVRKDHFSPPTSSDCNFIYSIPLPRTHSDSYSPKSLNGASSPSIYQGTSRRSSVTSAGNEQLPQEVSPIHVKFVSDSSKFWYKPTISRDEAISMLRNKAAGTFVVRNSNTFAGGFGMALKVSQVPANVQNNKDELVRHFLIEPTSRGVRLKGCANEPVFSSLSALVYQHSITPIALPSRLLLPERDIAPVETLSNQTQMLLVQGAACNVYYLLTLDIESLTGPQAVRKAVTQVLLLSKLEAKIVHFKVNKQGITLTDNKRELFFRKHYPINTISHCGLDPDDKRWNATALDAQHPSRKMFGFVARKPASNTDNQCHIFADMDPDQPASAIVSFVNKILTSIAVKYDLV